MSGKFVYEKREGKYPSCAGGLGSKKTARRSVPYCGSGLARKKKVCKTLKDTLGESGEAEGRVVKAGRAFRERKREVDPLVCGGGYFAIKSWELRTHAVG